MITIIKDERDIDETTGKRKEGTYAVVSKRPCNDVNLSLQGLGLWLLLVTKYPDGKFSNTDFKRNHNRIDSVQTILRELVANRYLKCSVRRLNGKYDGTDYQVFETPYDAPFSE